MPCPYTSHQRLPPARAVGLAGWNPWRTWGCDTCYDSEEIPMRVAEVALVASVRPSSDTLEASQMSKSGGGSLLRWTEGINDIGDW
jgi:hypothetical protein